MPERNLREALSPTVTPTQETYKELSLLLLQLSPCCLGDVVRAHDHPGQLVAEEPGGWLLGRFVSEFGDYSVLLKTHNHPGQQVAVEAGGQKLVALFAFLFAWFAVGWCSE